ncbi:MAG TPA: HI0074 family nucleotidyltransferase substrate-binding subunit [Bacillota bacterium]|nr:HI0074 family nucleotidyltransferase substrate-binding subunit [Bacillota bacterium]
MERLNERITMAQRALSAFEEVMALDRSNTIVRDAAIHRFEFTFEAIWKVAKQMLFDVEGIDIGSPKGVIRSCREIGIFSESDALQALQMVDHRNLTVHTYNEALAIEIYGQLAPYLKLLTHWLQEIRTRVSSN